MKSNNLNPLDVTRALNIIPSFVENSIFWTYSSPPATGTKAPVTYSAFLMVLRSGQEFLGGPIFDGQQGIIQVKDLLSSANRTQCFFWLNSIIIKYWLNYENYSIFYHASAGFPYSGFFYSPFNSSGSFSSPFLSGLFSDGLISSGFFCSAASCSGVFFLYYPFNSLKTGLAPIIELNLIFPAC